VDWPFYVLGDRKIPGKHSQRGMAYVKNLHGIMRYNNLMSVDNTVYRAGMRLLYRL
jgi:hypothetical protein